MDDDKLLSAALNMDWQTIKDVLGFGEPCLNGGRRVGGVCLCTKNFIGKLCEQIICYNGGYSINNNTLCECRDGRIRGRFCELLDCANGGTDSKEGHCACPYGWYSGRFCENYSTPWNVVLGVGIAILIILALACCICRLDLCQRCWRNNETDVIEDSEPYSSQLDRRYSWRWRDRSRLTDAIPAVEDASDEPTGTVLSTHTDPFIGRNGSTNAPSDPAIRQRSQQIYVKPPDYSPESPPPSYEEVAQSSNAAGQTGSTIDCGPSEVRARLEDSSL